MRAKLCPICGGPIESPICPHCTADDNSEKIAQLDAAVPDWRGRTYANGARMFREDGMMLDEQGNRSIFDDIDE